MRGYREDRDRFFSEVYKDRYLKNMGAKMGQQGLKFLSWKTIFL